MKRTPLQLALVSSLLVGFLWCVTSIFSTRYDSGSLYPAYSTYLPSPLGAKALYETFEKLENVTADLASDPIAFSNEPGGKGKLIFLLGLDAFIPNQPGDLGKALERMINEGSTVVIAATATKANLKDDRSTFKGPDEATEEDADTSEDITAENADTANRLSLLQWLDSHAIAFSAMEKTSLPTTTDESRITAFPQAEALSSPLKISLPLQMDFEEETQWTPLYTVGNSPIAAQTTIGSGNLIVFSDSYPFSNEGLTTSPNAELLAWLAKGKDSIVFVEEHLGVETYYGLMALTRRYGLDTALVLFAITCILFIWHGAFTAAPRDQGTQLQTEQVDLDAADQGLTRLLERSVDRKSLCQSTYSRWKASPAYRTFDKHQLLKLDELIAEHLKSRRQQDDMSQFFNKAAKLLTRAQTSGTKE